GADREGPVDGARRQCPLQQHLAAGEIFAVLVDDDGRELWVGESRFVALEFVAHDGSYLSRRPQPTMNGSTDLRTVFTSAGLAKAPSGVIDSPRRVLRTAAWRPSTLWIASALASTSGL